MDTGKFDYVFLDGGHKYETVKLDLECLIKLIKNNGTILCDDYNLTYAPGIKKAIDEYININNFNLKILKERFAEITKKTKLIIATSIFGQCPEIDKINAIGKKYSIPVIEDAAQSFGATYKNKKSCNLTLIGCTSFFPSKPLGCYGDGGAVFTNNSKIADSIFLFGLYLRIL